MRFLATVSIILSIAYAAFGRPAPRTGELHVVFVNTTSILTSIAGNAYGQLEPDHISAYQLTIEPETPFADLYAKGALTVPNDDQAADLYDVTQDLCAQAGLPAYEIGMVFLLVATALTLFSGYRYFLDFFRDRARMALEDPPA